MAFRRSYESRKGIFGVLAKGCTRIDIQPTRTHTHNARSSTAWSSDVLDTDSQEPSHRLPITETESMSDTFIAFCLRIGIGLDIVKNLA